MRTSDQEYFISERAAYEKLVAMTWPNGPVCPRCACHDRIYDLGHIRADLKKCGGCRKQFTIRTCTIVAGSHMRLNRWLQAVYLTYASGGIELVDILRIALELDQKAAQSFAHRTCGALGLASTRSSENRALRGQQKTVVKFAQRLQAISPSTPKRRPHARTQHEMFCLVAAELDRQISPAEFDAILARVVSFRRERSVTSAKRKTRKR